MPAACRAFVDRVGRSTPDDGDPTRRRSSPRVIDRLPPQSLEAEQSVLGAILIDRDAVIEVAEFLRPADFYRQANARIYTAVLELFERREPIDIVTVAETLERREELEAIGGRAYLSSLSNETPTAVHAVHYARIVERKAGLRNLIGAAGGHPGGGHREPHRNQRSDGPRRGGSLSGPPE